MPAKITLPKGCPLAIGGHEQRLATGEPTASPEKSPDFMLQRFVNERSGKRTIIIIPTAAEEPAAAAEDCPDAFTALRVEHLEVNIQSRAHAKSPNAMQP